MEKSGFITSIDNNLLLYPYCKICFHKLRYKKRWVCRNCSFFCEKSEEDYKYCLHFTFFDSKDKESFLCTCFDQFSLNEFIGTSAGSFKKFTTSTLGQQLSTSPSFNSQITQLLLENIKGQNYDFSLCSSLKRRYNVKKFKKSKLDKPLVNSSLYSLLQNMLAEISVNQRSLLNNSTDDKVLLSDTNTMNYQPNITQNFQQIYKWMNISKLVDSFDMRHNQSCDLVHNFQNNSSLLNSSPNSCSTPNDDRNKKRLKNDPSINLSVTIIDKFDCK